MVLNIQSFMGGTNFWGSAKDDNIFLPPGFDDGILEVVAVFGSIHMGASRIMNLQRHRIAQCRSVVIRILGSEGVPVQVRCADSEIGHIKRTLKAVPSLRGHQVPFMEFGSPEKFISNSINLSPYLPHSSPPRWMVRRGSIPRGSSGSCTRTGSRSSAEIGYSNYVNDRHLVQVVVFHQCPCPPQTMEQQVRSGSNSRAWYREHAHPVLLPLDEEERHLLRSGHQESHTNCQTAVVAVVRTVKPAQVGNVGRTAFVPPVSPLPDPWLEPPASSSTTFSCCTTPWTDRRGETWPRWQTRCKVSTRIRPGGAPPPPPPPPRGGGGGGGAGTTKRRGVGG